ncbi:Acid alpha-amylase-like [Oopsacas minuta]|uniref:alpha-amylase n=1 Tax=Oopsacas minuta TaxID=111878 RepID=A0AAV7KCL6_9METZ|nr:Acid alpha-amylase-like [Oopsacas minuta]
MKFIGQVFLFLANLLIIFAKSPQEWKSRIVYQLLTDRFSQSNSSSPCQDLSSYCGGTFQGIINHLDYIQNLGINAIWISPIILQTNNGYHGYWAQDIYQINPHFGTSQDLKDLVNACHSKDIWVMLDVVANHMGNQGNINDFSYFVPFNKAEYYHKYCIINNWANQTEVEICRLAGLPDLDQSNSFVSQTLLKWIMEVVSNYSFDGIRIDTVPEVPFDFWVKYAKSAGVYSVGECLNGNVGYVEHYQNALSGMLNYPMFFTLRDVFQNKQSMDQLRARISEESTFPDITLLGNFIDNHDNPRFLHQNGDYTLLINALTFTIFQEGIPIIYYGTEQGFAGGKDPNNRESLFGNFNQNHILYRVISTINKFKLSQGSDVYNSQQIQRYSDDQFYAYTRGMIFVGVSNLGSNGHSVHTITYHPYSNNTQLKNALNETDQVKVNNGKFQVNIWNGQPKLYFPN